MKNVSVRGGQGLGDAVYLQSVARHLIEKGCNVEACSAWTEVFLPLNGKVRVSPFRRYGITHLAHYSHRRGVPGTTQFQDACHQAGIREKVDLRLDWTLLNVQLFEQIKYAADGRPVIVVQMPRKPFGGRMDDYGLELLPRWQVFQTMIDELDDRVFFVQVGAGDPVFRFEGIHLDLANQTTVADLLDVCFTASGFLAYCSFLIPIAESFSKPIHLVWSQRGLRSIHEPVRQMTPQKILHRPKTSSWSMDDASVEFHRNRAHEFFDFIASRAAV